MNVDLLTRKDLEPITELLNKLVEATARTSVNRPVLDNGLPYIRMNIPKNFTFTVSQVATYLGCGNATVLNKIKLGPKDQEYLQAHRHGNQYVVYAWDLVDHIERTRVFTEQIKPNLFKP